ncbi:MAG: acetyl-CoA decarbonylase/synthase complex subunit delta [Desulfobacteraceae bacterium]|nr:MAG: acetyl-CoA decarbonylase/synthase complex subunit delta [Desulfobacteraceae bacterium]
MGFEIYKESYSGGIRNITIGKGKSAVTVGGETCYPFYLFEGSMPNKPRIAMEIWDIEPEDWPASVLSCFKDVVSDPVAWANKCINDYGAEMIVLQLKSADPNGKNASPEEVAATVKKVSAAIKVPLIVWGCANVQKDEAVLKKISEECQGASLTMGPVEDKNHKGIGASAMGYGHTIISSSPIDVNLAKQVNILLENLGVSTDKLIVDPTTGGLGYGMEYSYSVIERLRMAALSQGDDKLQYPIINNLGNEVWKCKEAKLTEKEAPTLGDAEKRGIIMEAVGAVSYLLAGSDILIMRHPEAVRLVKYFIDLLADGGSADKVEPIKKRLDAVTVDYKALSPEPNLAIEEEKGKKAEPAKKEAAPKAEAKPAAAKTEGKAAPAPAAKAEAAVAPKADAKAKDQDEAAVKAKAEADAKAKAEADAKARAEADARAKADAEAKAKSEADAKKKAEADAKAKSEADARAKKEAEEEALREKRAKERDERLASKKTAPGKGKKIAVTPAAEHKSETDRMLERLDRIHRRI